MFVPWLVPKATRAKTRYGGKFLVAYLIYSVYFMKDRMRFNQLVRSIWYDPWYSGDFTFCPIVISKKYFAGVVPDC